jgi:two-component system, chemotaxis family, chemotaxis protein CheY
MSVNGICNKTFMGCVDMVRTILVVESDTTVCSLVRYSLLPHNYAVIEAADLGEALEHLRRGKTPDLVIVGCDASERGQVELVREIRGYPGLRFAPILMMAGPETLGAQMDWKEAGATCWITKPFTHEEIREMVELLIF